MLRRRLTAVMAILVMMTVLTGLPARAAMPVNGAVYTTAVSCDPADPNYVVNQNVYASRDDVYLSGGPKTQNSNGLSPMDATWVWQITDPSGATLLSTEDYQDRLFKVGANGRITEYAGMVPRNVVTCETGTNLRVAIPLADFAPSPNGGGVYKLWITPLVDYHPDDPATNFGFDHSQSVTDNFKVLADVCEPGDPACTPDIRSTVKVYKFFDTNSNGAFDPDDEQLIPNWVMTLTNDSTQVLDEQNTPVTFSNLVNGFVYTVYEVDPVTGAMPGTGRSGFTWYATNQTPDPTSETFTADTTNSDIYFGNVCKASPTYGRTIGFWSNNNGQRTMGSTWQPVLLDVHANWYKPAKNYDLTTYTGFRAYILDANASKNTSMAWMLSAQLMATALSVHYNGLLPGDTIVWLDGSSMTVQALLDGAAGALNTPLSRSEQEVWKNRLDDFNNNRLLSIIGSAASCSAVYP